MRKSILFDKVNKYMNYKNVNDYYVKIPKNFLLEYNIEWDLLFDSIEKYIIFNYLKNKSKVFKIKMNKNWKTIIFHKIELNSKNKSAKKHKRVLIFVLLNKPKGVNTLFPIFSFNTQEEKKYNSKLLHTKKFVKKLFSNFSRYESWLDCEWNTLSSTLWKRINIY